MRPTPAIMIQGTGSNVGKSLLVASLCRYFAGQGLRVRPFKPQNMSNNAAAVDGGEIGRAQALQARAARVAPSVHMNPILLKPESERGSQLIVQGQRFGRLEARDFTSKRERLMPFVMESFTRLAEEADLVIVEGAGSPAETNLRGGDIANMGFAREAGVPVILGGDIDRGGVIASLVGTHAVLEADDRAMIRGFLINKFRGDPSLFAAGLDTITTRTGWRSIGILPWFPDAGRLPAEDAMDLRRGPPNPDGNLRIAVPVLPRIANFDDLDPLRLEPSVALTFVERGQALPGDADLIILPGSKATIADLAVFREEGWHIDLAAHIRRGGAVLGLCGGYQMLGRTIADPDGLEGPPGTADGLGHLAIDTVLAGDKTVRPVKALALAPAAPIEAYEIHLGRSNGADCARPLFQIDGRPEGARSPNGRVLGTYLHGLFTADAFRRAFLGWLAGTLADGPGETGLAYDATIEDTLDKLASHMARHLDTATLLSIARSRV
ncbi:MULTISPECIES: cobyric acid synthase [unclassified Chelatococcus]|uniref:cobyric acid synthase n=1 Tax=unclassified Chelatococcus TaxID=2638111 RepID=UPI001BCE016B|nr:MULTISPECIES: cobyric acid synthase [unclassified Chelatococcus]CAH1659083.1 Cobyric acid synthase [Hyphomicrobiales bacterium]MBS7740891.1 cobyric acid synthase [Chelatococcus sp. HY11]MBX3546818.1 cobyric acid synthase [Chelatococcus sp.]MCO5077709.1 cobyric acid synthase [Chelatococcus sp.]CAH1683932.1 Cobyric acid synthase [Hyphomicrobiales bacterium]